MNICVQKPCWRLMVKRDNREVLLYIFLGDYINPFWKAQWTSSHPILGILTSWTRRNFDEFRTGDTASLKYIYSIYIYRYFQQSVRISEDISECWGQKQLKVEDSSTLGSSIFKLFGCTWNKYQNTEVMRTGRTDGAQIWFPSWDSRSPHAM